MTIVTGFLGSGKTTLVNSALRDPAMRNALIVINEFGEIGLDHALVTNSSDNILVLENGCLCCTVFGDLVGTLNDVYHRREAGDIARFDRVVVETSGLADPTTVVQAFLSDPTLEGLYRLTGIVTVVDAVNIERTISDHDIAVRQIALADHVVVTKLDLVESGDQSAREAGLRALIESLNPRASWNLGSDPSLSLGDLLRWTGYDPGDGASQAGQWMGLAASSGDGKLQADHDHHHHHHDHVQIGSLCYIRHDPLPRLALQLLLEGIERNLGPNLLRLKAIVTVEGEDEGPAAIHGVQHLLHNMTWLEGWPFPDRASRFVLIASGMSEGQLGEMVALLDRIATRSADARAKRSVAA